MLRLAASQLRHRLGRTVALLVAIVIATASFATLTSSAEVSRLEVRGTVEGQFRSTYDLLVRPTASYTPMESADGLVRPNYQSGIFGGITREQLATIRAVRDVGVAAPVANIGIFPFAGSASLNVPYDPNGPVQQLFRVTPTWHSDIGTTRRTGEPSYVYVSRNPAVVTTPAGGPQTYAEVVPGQPKPVAVCANYFDDLVTPDPSSNTSQFGYRSRHVSGGRFSARFTCFYTPTTPPKPVEGQPFVDGAGDPGRITVGFPISYPILLTAIDPVAEAQLSNLSEAIVSGRPLRPDEKVLPGQFGDNVPVIAASDTADDTRVTSRVEAVGLPRGGIAGLLGTSDGSVGRVAKLPGTLIANQHTTTAGWADVLRRGGGSDVYWETGPVAYDQRGRDLVPRVVTNPEKVFETRQWVQSAPEGTDDIGFRTIKPHPQIGNNERLNGITVVGTFDPSKITKDARLSGVTSDTYTALALEGADRASRTALQDKPLGPNSNVAGYIASPPMMLTTLDAAATFLKPDTYLGGASSAPISVIRVRLSGELASDAVSRERLNQVALAIKQRTGLAVDIVAGASGLAQTIALPAGSHGRPELRLTENWAKKGVAYTVIDAVDRKSLLLFLLILAVCALAVANATSAAVRSRRSELGVLATLGWPTRKIFGVIVSELAVVGAAAGVIGTGVSLLIGRVADLPVSPSRALIAVPCAMALSIVAGLVPAVRASRAEPINALRSDIREPRRPRRVRGVPGLTLAMVARTPGRTLLAMLALTIAVAGVSALVTLQRTFDGAVVGSLLGDAVALQVRGADIAAVVAICLLAALAVADVIYLGVREQAGELAALRATGWRDRDVSQLVVGQGAIIGMLGACIGAALGAMVIARLAGSVDRALLGPMLIAAAVGVALSMAAAAVPALLIRSWSITQTLSSEEA